MELYEPQNSNVSFPSSSKELQKMLESEHPTYTKMKKTWQDCLNWYLGEEITRYIFQHIREKEVNYRRRKDRAYYLNYVREIVDIIASFIFSKTVSRQWESQDELEAREQEFQEIRSQRTQEQMEFERQQKQQQFQQQLEMQQQNGEEEGGPPQQGPPQPQPQSFGGGDFGGGGGEEEGQLQEPNPEDIVAEAREYARMAPSVPPELQSFWDDIDLRGSSIDAHMQMICLLAQVFGHVDDVVDMPSIPDDYPENPTMADQKEANLRPYVYTIFPLDFLNWEVDDKDEFVWARWREQITGNVGPFEERPSKPSWRYYTWTRSEWFVHEVVFKGKSNQPDISLVRAGEHELGMVPVVRYYNKRYLLDPVVGHSAISDIGKVNIAILNWCSLIDEEVYQKCLNILVMEEPADKTAGVEIGSNNVLLWSGETPPFYLAPASEPGQFMLELIDRGIQEIYRLAKLAPDTGVAKEAQSGVAYSYEFNQTNRMLADTADQLERGEDRLHKLWALWQGLEWEGSIDYPDQFDVERLEDEVNRLSLLKQSVRSQTFKRELEKRTATRALAKVPAHVLNRVHTEIDMSPEEKPTFFPMQQ